MSREQETVDTNGRLEHGGSPLDETTTTAPSVMPVIDTVADPGVGRDVGRPYRVRGWPAVAALAFGGFCVSLVHTLVVPLLPTLPHLLDASPTAVSWLVTATLLTSAIATPLLGRLGDQFGRRRLILVTLAIFVAGSVLCAVTSQLPLLIVGRGLQGCGLAVIPLGISVIGTTLSPGRRAAGIAFVSATLGFGAAIGLPTSGIIAEYADFHTLFWICAVAGLGAAVWIRVSVPATPVQADTRIDYVGAALLAITLAVLLIPLANGSTWGWASPMTLVPAASFPIVAVAFVRHQSVRAWALVDIRAARQRPVILTNIVSVLIGFVLYANFLGMAPYVEAPTSTGYGFGVSPLVGGLCMLPSGLVSMVMAPVTARLINRRGARQPLILGSLVVAVGYALRMALTGHIWQVLVAATVVSAGGAIAYSTMPALILDASPRDEASAATGLNTLARSIGTTLASACATAILGTITVSIAGVVFPSRTAFLVFFLCGALAAIVAALVTSFVAVRR